MKKLIRERYLAKVRPFYDDNEIIKVFTGVRRCGKSTLMEQIRDELLEKGVNPSNIIFLNLDKRPYKSLVSADAFEKAIDRKIEEAKKDELIYLFIDEIQNIKDFEPSINAYREEGISVFIAGSNSYLLSGKLVTKLTGRYIEIPVHTLSYSESIELKKLNQIAIEKDDFITFLRWGGFPKSFEYNDESSKMLYISSTIDEILSKDILKKAKVRNAPLLRKCIDFLSSNPALTISPKAIAMYLRNENIKTKQSTIERYVSFIFDSKICDKVNRYNIKGKNALRTLYKSYLSDLSFKTFASNNPKSLDFGLLLENVVYHELTLRGYQTMVGKWGNKEIDFIARKGSEIYYIQVCYLMGEKGSKTYEREIAPLLDIKDNYPKYILSMDPFPGEEKGIIRYRIVDDFLLGDSLLK